TNPLQVVFKFDVRSGKRAAPLWSFDPDTSVDTIYNYIRNRGVALIDNKAIVNTTDGRAIALNRDSGEVLWQKQVGVPVAEGFTSQPIAVKDKVLVGNSRGD